MDTPELRSHLLAILAADAVGYSRLMSLDDLATVAALDAARAVFREEIAARGGRVIDMAGDSVLAGFDAAAGAVNAALRVQVRLAELVADVPEDRRMKFRIGIHVGDVIEKADGTVYGDGVNIAARLEGLAAPGAVAVSQAVHGIVARRVDAVFEDIGEQTVKNIAQPVRAFRVRRRLPGEAAIAEPTVANEVMRAPNSAGWLARLRTIKGAIVAVASIGAVLGGLAGYANFYKAADARAQSASLLALVGKGDAGPLSIVVLPFANLTGDPQQAYVADGLTAAVTADLSRIRDAFIVSTATAFAYKDKTITVQQIGKELGVRFVLQGGVQRDGTKIRINAQLADTKTNAQLWSESFDGHQADLFGVQDLVTTRIGNSIGREMLVVAARESEARKSDPTVADLLLRARALSLKPESIANYLEQQALYRQALLIDPSNAKAMIGLARSLSVAAYNRMLADPSGREKQLLEGRDLALNAKKLDPNDPRIYDTLGMYAGTHDDYAGAKRISEIQLVLDPKNPNAYHNLALDHFEAGEPSKAIELMSQGIRLDPKGVDENTLGNMGMALFMLGNDDAAIAWLLKALDLNPGVVNAYPFLAMAYARKGDMNRSNAALAALFRLDPKFTLEKFHNRKLEWAPPAYRAWWDTKLLPAWRLTLLPE